MPKCQGCHPLPSMCQSTLWSALYSHRSGRPGCDCLATGKFPEAVLLGSHMKKVRLQALPELLRNCSWSSRSPSACLLTHKAIFLTPRFSLLWPQPAQEILLPPRNLPSLTAHAPFILSPLQPLCSEILAFVGTSTMPQAHCTFSYFEFLFSFNPNCLRDKGCTPGIFGFPPPPCSYSLSPSLPPRSPLSQDVSVDMGVCMPLGSPVKVRDQWQEASVRPGLLSLFEDLLLPLSQPAQVA